MSPTSKTIQALMVFSLIALVGCATSRSDLDRRAGFLREQPYEKQKQIVDLSGIASDADFRVVKEAINPIIYFFNVLSSASSVHDRLMTVATLKGAENLRIPPIDRDGPYRESPRRIYNWRVVDTSTVAFMVEFGGLFPKLEPYTDSFVFVKTDAGWRFDRH